MSCSSKTGAVYMYWAYCRVKLCTNWLKFLELPRYTADQALVAMLSTSRGSQEMLPTGSPLGPSMSRLSAVRGLVGFVAVAVLIAEGPVCLSWYFLLVTCLRK